jgi:hypothetical protein
LDGANELMAGHLEEINRLRNLQKTMNAYKKAKGQPVDSDDEVND